MTSHVFISRFSPHGYLRQKNQLCLLASAHLLSVHLPRVRMLFLLLRVFLMSIMVTFGAYSDLEAISIPLEGGYSALAICKLLISASLRLSLS